MIDERIDEGVSEEDAVAAIGDSDDIAAQILSEIPLGRIVKENAKSRRSLKAWEIVLLIVGSPLWGSLLIATLTVILVLYASLWSAVVSLWAAFIFLVASALGGVIGGMALVFGENPLSGIALIGAAIVCAGLSIFTFFGCKAVTKFTVILPKKIIIWIKNAL